MIMSNVSSFCIVVCILMIPLVLALYLFITQDMRKAKEKFRSLPPGSMGWPYIGETLQFYSQDPRIFFASKHKRYGDVFKTHLLGYPCVMLTSPEAAKFVLVTQAHLFKPTYPKSKERMIGPYALFFHQGEYHQNLRKIVQGSMSPDVLRGLMEKIEKLVVSMLHSWDDHKVNIFLEMKKLSFDVGVLTVFGGELDEKYKVELSKNYHIVDKGYNKFLTNIPGTQYYKATQARKRLGNLFHEIMTERKQRRASYTDLLGCFMNSKDDKGQHLSDEQIADNIIGVLFAAQDTTASALTWIIKYLHDNSNLLQVVKSEQLAIFESNESGKKALTWTQTRTMSLTHRFILESLRMASIISFTFREAVADVEYNGYLIPKGWKVMPLFRNIHYSQQFFGDPHKFDPSRFEVSPKPNTFFPFGSGVHACPGNELAKLEMYIFIHHLVTKYRLDILSSNSEVEYSPFPIPKHGLQVKLRKF